MHGFPVTYLADQSIHGSWLVFSKKRARAYREEYFTSSSSVRYFCNMFSISPFNFKIWGTGKVNIITSAFVLTSSDLPLDVSEAPAQSISPLTSTEWRKVEEWNEQSEIIHTGGKLWRGWAQFKVINKVTLQLILNFVYSFKTFTTLSTMFTFLLSTSVMYYFRKLIRSFRIPWNYPFPNSWKIAKF